MLSIRRKTRNPATRSAPSVNRRTPRLELLEDRTLLDAGALDPTFGSGGQVLTEFTGLLDSTAVASLRQPDNKLVVAGQGSNGTTAEVVVARYNPDGSLDAGFGAGGRAISDVAFTHTANLQMAVTLQSDSKVLVAALPRSAAMITSLVVARFNADGTRDTSFGAGGKFVQEFSRVSVTILDVAFQADTRVLVLSQATTPNAQPSVARYNPDGAPDPNFGANGVVPLPANFTSSLSLANLLVQADGRIILVGLRSPSAGGGTALHRLNADGSLDRSYGGRGTYNPTPTHLGAAVQPNGWILVAGTSAENFDITRYNPAGQFGPTADVSRNTDFGGNDGARAVALQADGMFVVAGVSVLSTTANTSRFAVARYRANGQPDTSFGTDGKTGTDFGFNVNDANGVWVQADGKVVVVGTTADSRSRFAVARFNVNGTLDPTFGTGGKVVTDFTGPVNNSARGVAVQADGKLLVVGPTSSALNMVGEFVLARYLTTGALDPAFGTGGRVTTGFDDPSQALAVVVQPDGKIVAAGSAGTNMAVARYLADGSPDAGFGNRGKLAFPFPIGVIGGTAVAYGLALQADGKLVAAGGCGLNPVLARLNPDGSFDTTFGTGGRVGDCATGGRTVFVSARVALQADGKIVTAVALTGSGSGITLRRYNADGSPDAGFGTNGTLMTPLAIDLGNSGPALRVQADGKILVGGTLPTAAVSPAVPGTGFAVARYNPNGALDTTFGSGGVAVLDFIGRDTAADLLVQADGRIIVVGPANEAGTGSAGITLARLLPNGGLDASLGVAGKVSVPLKSSVSPAAAAALASGDKLVVVGGAPGAGGSLDFLVTRFTLADTWTTANQRFVGQLYLNLLGRLPEPAGLVAFAGALDQGTLTRPQVSQIIAGSLEYRTNVVRNLYRTILNREGDTGGVGFFADFLGRGGTVAHVKATLLGSAEYLQARTDGTNDGFVTALFRLVLDRDVDPVGRDIFRRQLAAGVPRDNVAFNVVTSRESLERIVQGWFRLYLRRSADPGGVNAFAAYLQGGGREELAIAVLLSSGEFAAGL